MRNPAFLDASAELLQSGFWARFKRHTAGSASRVQLGGATGDLRTCSCSPGPCSGFSRSPTFPSVPAFDPCIGRGELLSRLGRALRSACRPATLLLSFDLPWEKERGGPGRGGAARLYESASDMQPPNTVIVDIAPALDEVLRLMKSKTRYNVRLSAKKGVEVREAGVEDSAMVRAVRGDEQT